MGGWSAAFKDRGHEVFTLDFEPKFNPDLCMDIHEARPSDFPPDPDVILASPPCNCFSTASLGHYWVDGRPREHRTLEALAVVMKTLWLIRKLEPKYWAMENPRGMLRTVIGKPDITTFFASWGVDRYKPTDLWGKLPRMTWPKPKNWVKSPRGSDMGTHGMGPELAAMIPYGLSEALCQAIENELNGHS